jgi:hypothetical protein
MSTALGWGYDPFGTSLYGGSASGVTSLSGALAVATNTVRVTTNGLVLDNSAAVAGDALNPATWTVTRLDTGANLNVVSVTQVSAFQYDLLTLFPFGPSTVTHQVTTASLLDATGNPIGSPRTVNFAGLLAAAVATAQAKLASKRLSTQDIANAPAPGNLYQGGTLKLDAAGDYETVSGAELIRKLIYRRLTTTPGDFFHLPNYGLGLLEKEVLRASDVVALKRQLEAQVLLEPEVEACTASLSLGGDGILHMQVFAKLRATGEKVSVSAQAQTGKVVL